MLSEWLTWSTGAGRVCRDPLQPPALSCSVSVSPINRERNPLLGQCSIKAGVNPKRQFKLLLSAFRLFEGLRFFLLLERFC